MAVTSRGIIWRYAGDSVEETMRALTWEEPPGPKRCHNCWAKLVPNGDAVIFEEEKPVYYLCAACLRRKSQKLNGTGAVDWPVEFIPMIPKRFWK